MKRTGTISGVTDVPRRDCYDRDASTSKELKMARLSALTQQYLTDCDGCGFGNIGLSCLRHTINSSKCCVKLIQG